MAWEELWEEVLPMASKTRWNVIPFVCENIVVGMGKVGCRVSILIVNLCVGFV